MYNVLYYVESRRTKNVGNLVECAYILKNNKNPTFPVPLKLCIGLDENVFEKVLVVGIIARVIYISAMMYNIIIYIYMSRDEQQCGDRAVGPPFENLINCGDCGGRGLGGIL